MTNPVPVTRLRAPQVTDVYGDTTTFDWDNATSTVLPGAVWAPITNSESNDLGREGVVIGWRLYVRGYVPDVVGTDRLLWDGQTYRVDGDPARFEHPITGQLVTEIIVERVEG